MSFLSSPVWSVVFWRPFHHMTCLYVRIHRNTVTNAYYCLFRGERVKVVPLIYFIAFECVSSLFTGFILSGKWDTWYRKQTVRQKQLSKAGGIFTEIWSLMMALTLSTWGPVGTWPIIFVSNNEQQKEGPEANHCISVACKNGTMPGYSSSLVWSHTPAIRVIPLFLKATYHWRNSDELAVQ